MPSLTAPWKLPLSAGSWFTAPLSGERVPIGAEALTCLSPPPTPSFTLEDSASQHLSGEQTAWIGAPCITWHGCPWRLQNAPRAGEWAGALATALLRKTGTGRALTWPRVSLLPKERPELNGPFMGQWEASRLAVIPRPPPCPAWGPCCPTPFTVYPELASTGMWFQAVPPQVPATSDSRGSLPGQPPPPCHLTGAPGFSLLCQAPSRFAQFPSLGRCGGIPLPERMSEPAGHCPASRY